MDIIIEDEASVPPPDVMRPVKTGDIINDKYEVKKELGEGGFGLVLEVLNRITNERLAMKVELFEPKADEPGLHLEASVLRRLQGYSHILKYYDEGRLDSVNFLVMQLAGASLSDLRRSCPENRFTTSTTVLLALQALRAIENVHVAGMLHRDIKPGNFALGKEDTNKHTLYILDFGLVRRYRLKNNKVRPKRSSVGFRGSVRYASINAHKNLDLGRHDDIWSWMYTMVELHKGELPWCNQLSRKKVGEMKSAVKMKDLLADMQPEFCTIYTNLEKLQYASTPPYSMYRDQLMKIIKRKKYSLTMPFDWELGGIYYEHVR